MSGQSSSTVQGPPTMSSATSASSSAVSSASSAVSTTLPGPTTRSSSTVSSPPSSTTFPPPTISAPSPSPVVTPPSNSPSETPPPSTTSTPGTPVSTLGPGSSTSTLIFSTVVVTTDPNGQVQTETVRSTELTFPTQSQNSSGGSSSNTAAIAGGVVGGAVGLLALILVVFFILKRRQRKDEFDGNFDPDRLEPERFGGNAARPGAMPDIDLVGAEVTPFQYHAETGQQQGYGQYPQMAQRPGMSAPVMGGPGYGGSDVHSSATGSRHPTTATDQSLTGMQNMDFRGPSPGPSLGTSGTFPSSKERELASERRRLHVANDEHREGGSSQGSSGVVQHKDGGRVQQQSVPDEVPPSYDSISPDERAAAGRS